MREGEIVILFYNDKDEICLKMADGKYKVLYDDDIFQLGDQYWNYKVTFFFPVVEIDGDMWTEWDKRVHPRKMNIVEMEEAFAAPTYGDVMKDYVFKYEENLTDNEQFIMSNIVRKVENAHHKYKEYATCCLSKYDYDNVQKEGLNKILSLLNEDYQYELDIKEEVDDHKDVAVITLFW